MTQTVLNLVEDSFAQLLETVILKRRSMIERTCVRLRFKALFHLLHIKFVDKLLENTSRVVRSSYDFLFGLYLRKPLRPEEMAFLADVAVQGLVDHVAGVGEAHKVRFYTDAGSIGDCK